MKKKTSKRIAIKISKNTVPKVESKLKLGEDDVKKTSIKLPTTKPSKPKAIKTKAIMPKRSSTVTTKARHAKSVSDKKEIPEANQPKQTKQTREQKKWMHVAELSEAKLNLQNAINQEIQKERANGNTAQVTPQILTLLRTPSYSTKAVTRMKKMFNDRDALREYLFIVDNNGTILSGDKAIARYEQFAKSGIAKPTYEADVILQNFYEHLQSVMGSASDEHYYNEDNTALTSFINLMQRLVHADVSAVSENQWRTYRPNIKTADSRDWVVKEGSKNVDSIGYWFDQWVNAIGEDKASAYISQNAEDLNESLIKLAIGYFPDSSSAFNSLRAVFSSSGADKIISLALNDVAQQDDYGLDFHDEG